MGTNAGATGLSLGEQLDEIRLWLDAATDAWSCAGHPNSGPTVSDRESAFYALHLWNHRADGSAPGCPSCRYYEQTIADA